MEHLEQQAELAREGEALVYGTHPCMWSCSMFYDMHNVKRRGLPPAREKWQPAPLLSPARLKRDRKFLQLYLDVLLAHGLQFTTYGALAEEHAQPQEWLTPAQLATLARQIIKRFSAASASGRGYNCAEVLAALCHALSHLEGNEPPRRIPVVRPLGPVQTPRALAEPLAVCGRALVGAATKMDAEIRQTGIIPPGVDVGGHHFSPAQLLLAAAEGYLRVIEGEKPSCSPLEPGPDCPAEAELLAEARIGAWSLPADYAPTELLEIGRLQSWTLKMT
jgi:hypothetical protein